MSSNRNSNYQKQDLLLFLGKLGIRSAGSRRCAGIHQILKELYDAQLIDLVYARNVLFTPLE